MATKGKAIGSEQTPETKIAEITKDLTTVIDKAKTIKVVTQQDYESAANFLTTQVKSRINRIKEVMKFFTDPYLEARRVALKKMQEIEAMFNQQLNPLLKVESELKDGINAYLKEQDRLARAEEERLRKIRERQDAKREEQGKPINPMPVPVVERQAPTIQTENGRVTTKKVWKSKVINPLLVPREYLEVNEVLIRRAVASGVREIAGVQITEEFETAGSARY